MNYYKNEKNEVFAFDDEAIKDIVIPAEIGIDENGNEVVLSEAKTTPNPYLEGLTRMTDEEVELHLNPPISPDVLKKQQLDRLQRIYTKQSIRITAIQIDKEFSNDSEYIKAQLQNYELRYNIAKYTLNDTNATEEDKTIANAVIQASEASTMFVAYARTVLDVIRGNLTDAINSGADVNAKLDILDDLVLSKDNITKEKIDSFLTNLNG